MIYRKQLRKILDQRKAFEKRRNTAEWCEHGIKWLYVDEQGFWRCVKCEEKYK